MNQQQISAIAQLEDTIKIFRYHLHFLLTDVSVVNDGSDTLPYDLRFLIPTFGTPNYENDNDFFVAVSAHIDSKTLTKGLMKLNNELHNSYLLIQNEKDKNFFLDRIHRVCGHLNGIFANGTYMVLKGATMIISQKRLFDHKKVEIEENKAFIIERHSEEYYEEFIGLFSIPDNQLDAANKTRNLLFHFESARAILYKFLPDNDALIEGEPETEAIPESRENQFNKMPLDQVKIYFRPLTEGKSKNGKPFLTEEQFCKFIERAFEDMTDVPALTLNLGTGERTTVRGLFYAFYLTCTLDFQFEPTRHCKEKYVRLLTNHFTNYEYSTVSAGFNTKKRL